MKDKISAIICAAGKGERAGFGKNKLLVPLFGAPVLWHTLEKFNIPEIDEVIVASSEEDFKEISALCAPFGYKAVPGGKTRTESVKRALSHVSGDIVLIHDGARPFVSRGLILKCVDSVKKFGSGVCAVKITDTAVYAEYGEIHETLERNRLYRVQTPQGFTTEDIVKAYSAVNEPFTDDSSVYAKYVCPPRLVEGEESNIKLTHKSDFPAEYVAVTPADGCRAGIGNDTHAFGEGDGVTLCGVKIPCDKKLVAHSDGDAPLHALMDALLSAAGLRDIGVYFPDGDEKYRGADSMKLLQEVVKTIAAEGFAPVNASITVQTEKPKLSPHICAMKANVARVLRIPESAVGITCGTNEHLGFVGAGLGVSAWAAVTVKRI